ncbi:hypothetical protein WA158_007833 [Blastocystis sp. Blastoise]
MQKTFLVDKISSTVNLDALPYIDRELEEPGMQDKVDDMIAEEMQMFIPKDYLNELDMPDYKFENDIIMQNEFTRMKAGKPMAPLDISRYKVSPPSSEEQNDPESWRGSVENAQAQLEQQKSKIINLQLLEKFGKNAWRRHNDELECLQQCYEDKNQEIKSTIEQINKKRKSEQEVNYEKIRKLNYEYNELIFKNYQIDATCQAIEGQLKKQNESKN